MQPMAVTFDGSHWQIQMDETMSSETSTSIRNKEVKTKVTPFLNQCVGYSGNKK